VGQRDILERFASIKKGNIKGYRAPFLQTSGEITFKVTKPKYLNQYNFSLLIKFKFLQFLADNGFLYDSSMPILSDSIESPIFPYTLDQGFRQNCVMPPCPKDTDKHPGLWEVPIIDYWRKRVVIDGNASFSNQLNKPKSIEKR
jgi:hypothetical protein